jgi:hypothetical protein
VNSKIVAQILVLLLLGCASACRSRGFNKSNVNELENEDSNSEPKITAAGLDPSNKAALLADDPKFPPTNEPPTDFAVDALVFLGSGKFLSTLLDDKGQVIDPGQKDVFLTQPMDVLKHEYVLRKVTSAMPAPRNRPIPEPLAAASVLKLLRKNRVEFSQTVEGGMKNEPNMLEIGKLYLPTIRNPLVTMNPTRPFSETSCQPYDPEHFSDIKWTYYCSVPALYRACHRLLIGTWYDKNIAEKIENSAPEQRESVISAFGAKDFDDTISYCTEPDAFPPGPQKQIYESTLRNNEDGGPGSPWRRGIFIEFFRKFYKSQESEDGKVNMFTYIMKSHVFAFDYTQQQAVINEYFGDMKPTKLGNFNPSIVEDCNTYREARKYKEKVSNHCDPKAGKSLPLYSIGR